jgi:hypothetical protein
MKEKSGNVAGVVVLIVGAVLLVGGIAAGLIDASVLAQSPRAMPTLSPSAYTGGSDPGPSASAIASSLFHPVVGVAILGALLIVAAIGLLVSGRSSARAINPPAQ